MTDSKGNERTSHEGAMLSAGSPPMACASHHGRHCWVYIVQASNLANFGMRFDYVWRHEIGHCNGWGADHVGAVTPPLHIPVWLERWAREQEQRGNWPGLHGPAPALPGGTYWPKGANDKRDCRFPDFGALAGSGTRFSSEQMTARGQNR
jgi:hypothetical protein